MDRLDEPEYNRISESQDVYGDLIRLLWTCKACCEKTGAMLKTYEDKRKCGSVTEATLIQLEYQRWELEDTGMKMRDLAFNLDDERYVELQKVVHATLNKMSSMRRLMRAITSRI